MYNGYNQLAKAARTGARQVMHGASQVSEWDGRAWREDGLLRRARLSAKPSLRPVSPRSTWVNIDAHTWILWTRDALELVVVVASFVV